MDYEKYPGLPKSHLIEFTVGLENVISMNTQQLL